MPETPSSRVRGHKVNATRHKHKPHPDTSDEGTDLGDRPEDGGSRPSQESRDNSDTEEEHKDSSSTDPEDKLASCLLSSLSDCSRQRLRALHMTLRHYGNVDNRVSFKDFQTSLQSNQIKLTPRALQLIPENFEDAQGLDYERLYRCMSKAHLRTGRDSIKARNKRNDLNNRQVMTTEEVDADFLRRLEEQIVRDQTYFDVDALRSEFVKWDTQVMGKISKEGAYLICSERTPLYGALLKNLINRCDEDKDTKLSWPLLLNFLETAQGNAWTKHPELSSLPEKGREKATLRITTPEPIDEMSSTTKVKVVNKLLKKRSDSPTDASQTGEYKLFALHRQVVGQSDLDDFQGDEEEEQMHVTTERRVHYEDSSNEIIEDSKPTQILANQPPATDSTLGSDGQGGADGRGDEREVPKPETDRKEDDNKIKEGHEIPLNEASLGVTISGQADGATAGPHEQGPASETRQTGLQLEWIYGYHGSHSHSLGQLASGEVVYFIASTVVVYSRRGHLQRHYREHTAAVQSLAVHSEGVIVASAQGAALEDPGQSALVRVWRSNNLETLTVLGQDGVLSGSVRLLSFMSSSNTLACVDEGSLSVWETRAGTLVARAHVSTDRLTGLHFSPCTPDTLVTCGHDHLAWWTISAETARLEITSRPSYDKHLKGLHYTCLCHNTNDDVITGDTAGNIQFWGQMGAKVIGGVKGGHEGPVLALLHHDGHLLTAGQDGAINCWTGDTTASKGSSLQLPATEGGARSLAILPGRNKRASVLVVGTTFNSLIAVTLSQGGSPLAGVVLKDVPITQGHTDDLRAVRPISRSFLGADVISASVDGAICKLNSETRKAVWKLWMKGFPFVCLDTNMDGDQVFLGTMDGRLVILAIQRQDLTVVEVLNKKISSGAVTCVKLSPDEKMVAVVSAEKHVHVYSLQGEVRLEKDQLWARVGKCKSQTKPVERIDWSNSRLHESHVIRISNLKQENTFWDVTSRSQICDSEAALLGWDVNIRELKCTFQDIQSQLVDPDHVTCADVSQDGRLVAVATRQGVLGVYRCIASQEPTPSPAYPAHQRTCNMCFTANGRSLLTVGGPDLSIMQWSTQ